MFRFFCTIEQRVKRIHSKPINIDESTISLGDPNLRLGQCNSHFITKTARVIKSNKIETPTPVLVRKGKRR